MIENKNIYLKTLVFQPTGHVVWLAVDPSRAVPQKRVPSGAEYSLDFKSYRKEMPTAFNYSREFRNYNLCFNGAELSVAPLPAEFKDMVRVTRAKCYAVTTIHLSIRALMDKSGTYQNPLTDLTLDTEMLAEIYHRRQNISMVDARKLVEFKQEEFRAIDRTLKYLQLDAEVAINGATTVEQVMEHQTFFCNSAGVKAAYDYSSLL